MYITFRDGTTVEAVILARTDTTIRASLAGAEDVQEFSKIQEAWVSDDCEVVRIEFACERTATGPIPSVRDCIFSKELAAQLFCTLFNGDAPREVDAVRQFNSLVGARVN